MKTVVAFILLTLSTALFAADYQCFSYQTGKQVRANSDTGEIVIKDRFGNELDVINEAQLNIRILATVPETVETHFVVENDTVLILQEQGEFIRGVFESDDSLQCRILKTETL